MSNNVGIHPRGYVGIYTVIVSMNNLHCLFKAISYPEPAILLAEEGMAWPNPFVFPTNPGDPVFLRMCKVFQDGEHANRNTHYILILGRI